MVQECKRKTSSGNRENVPKKGVVLDESTETPKNHTRALKY